MPCNCNTPTNTPCGCQPCDDSNPECSCPIKDLSTDCVLYTGDDLPCSGIVKDSVLTDLIQRLDEFICEVRDDILAYVAQVTTLINIGGGAGVYKQPNGLGNKELRTIISEDDSLLDIIENADTIGIRAGTPSIELDSNTDILSLIMTTLSGAITLSDVDLSEYNYDTFVQGATFSDTTEILTITRNNGEPNIDVDLSYLNNHLETVNYTANSNEINFTLTDGTVLNLDLSTLLAEIADTQVQSDYLENDITSKAHILNRNPSKSVTGNYSVVDTDNNYIIEIDNGVNDVTINLGPITASTEFFVGFVQKGTGIVTFSGYDIKPLSLSDIIFGQGHAAAVEVINSTKYLHGNLLAE